MVLAFDEAHTLTEPKEVDVENLWSRFSEFQCALCMLNSLPVFSLFISTTMKVQGFILPQHQGTSNRIQCGTLVPILPFTETGFNQLAKGLLDGLNKTIYEVVQLQFMSMLGQPLLRFLAQS